MNSIERRKHPRVAISVDVDIGSGSNFYTGRARDISEGGIFIESPLFAPVGTSIELSLRLSGHRYDIPAEVTWVLYDDAGAVVGFGCKFLELRRPVRRAILEFMSTRAPMPFDLLEAEDVEETSDPAPPAAPVSSRDGLVPPRKSRVMPPPLPT